MNSSKIKHPVEHSIPAIPVIHLQVNYTDRIVFYSLDAKGWDRVKDRTDNKCFVAVWKLRKLKPFGPPPPRPLSFLIDPDIATLSKVKSVLSQTGFSEEDYEVRQGKAWSRIILKQYGIRQTAAIFHAIGCKNIAIDIL